jgi:cell wall-associated NlpC family hydrolase
MAGRQWSMHAGSVTAGASYRIHSGDTLWAIASRLRSQGVSGSVPDIIRRIQQLNPSITNPNLIITGRSLTLPGRGSTGSARPSQRPSDGFQPSGPRRPELNPISVPRGSTRADEVRAQAAQWAIAQANNPTIGYSQTKGRFGNATDSNGRRYFDCSGLVYTAYRNLGVRLGGNWTGAMRSTWPQWADQVPKDLNQMKPGDLLLMNGHVVMYTGNGRCVGAQTSNTAFADQVTTNIDARRYLARADCIVLRPHV